MAADEKRLADLRRERDTLNQTIEVMEEIKALKEKLQQYAPQPTYVPYPVPYPVYPQPIWVAPTWHWTSPLRVTCGATVPLSTSTITIGSSNRHTSGFVYYGTTDTGVYTDDDGLAGCAVPA